MNNLLKDLKAVALLADKATPGEWVTTVGHHVKQAHGVMVVAKNELRGEVAQHNAAYIATLHNFIRTHHAEIAEAVKLAKWYRGLRDADPDNGEPYIARERQDSWGNWKTEWLGGLDADRALDAMHNSAREAGE